MDNKSINNNAHVIEQISAYLDGALGDAVSDGVREHIDSCAVCHAEYMEVRATRSLLKNMTAVSLPRAFTLTPEMVGRKVWLWQRLLVPRNVPRLATGSALAFALMAFLVLGDLASIGSSQNVLTVSESSSAQRMVSVPPAAGGVTNLPTTEVNGYDVARSAEPPDGLMASTPMMEATRAADSAALPQATPDLMMQSPGNYKVPTQPEPLRTQKENSPPIAETPVTAMLDVAPTVDTRFYIVAQPTIDGRVSQPATQVAPDGGRVLFLSLEGLLVTIGALFAVGAVFAARR